MIIILFKLCAILTTIFLPFSILIKVVFTVIEGIDYENPIIDSISIFGIVTLTFSLIFFNPYFIIPVMAYFITGYLLSLKWFPDYAETNEYRICLDDYEVVYFIIDMIVYWPIVLLYKINKNILRSIKGCIKTPLGEWEKRKNGNK